MCDESRALVNCLFLREMLLARAFNFQGLLSTK